MKTDIHPKYHDKAKVTCSCGASFTVGGTLEKLELEVCSECHPFYTGKGKLVDTAGRVEKFHARKSAAEDAGRGGKQNRKSKNTQRREARAKRLEEQTKSLG
jgi:large subunit ribosomal protein L31